MDRDSSHDTLALMPSPTRHGPGQGQQGEEGRSSVTLRVPLGAETDAGGGLIPTLGHLLVPESNAMSNKSSLLEHHGI